MKMNIKATGIELTPAISNYAEKKLEKLNQYIYSDALVSVELGKTTNHHKQGDIFRAEVRVSGAGLNVYAVKEGEDLYAAIDEVRDEVVGDVTKNVSKKRELMRRGQRAIKDMVRGFPWFGRK